MPLLADLIVALLAGLLAYLFARWYAHSPATPDRPAVEAARAVGEAVKPHGGLRRQLARRTDREVASGLLLSLALAVVVAGGLVLGVLAVLVRRVAAIQHVDNSVAAWGYDHRSGATTRALHAITDLGDIRIVFVLALLLALVHLWRTRSRRALLFLLVVLLGMELAQLGVKHLVGRLRPALVPEAATLGPSFPSGHSATAAAFYAAAALVIARGLRRPARQLVVAAAVAIAVGVAASRVLLDFHWLSDVIGGLALGWAWFALCAVVFGGLLLRPTAAADVAAAEAAAGDRSAGSPPGRVEHESDGNVGSSADRRHAERRRGGLRGDHGRRPAGG
jgi:undecaprenyl-diphosphatase